MKQSLPFIDDLHEVMTANKVVFVECYPEIKDCTVQWDGKLLVHGKGRTLEFSLDLLGLNKIAYILKHSIFAKGKLVITWDIKKLFSYFRFHIHDKYLNYLPNCTLLDLKYCESFYGANNAKPNNLKEAIVRAKPHLDNKEWNIISSNIHYPLALEVLPSIEQLGVLNIETKRHLFPYYEIEGQVNGRLRCEKISERTINPHGMSQDIKNTLRPCGFENTFIELDFNHLEGSVLAWVTKDPVLVDLMSEKDLYSAIHEVVFGSTCNTKGKRDNMKVLFLSIMFGAQPKSIAKKFNIDIQKAILLYNKVCKIFYVSIEWFNNKQKAVEYNKFAIDAFGRKRIFNDGFYRSRNFFIQSPAAIICLERLVKLYNEFKKKLIFHIHDSYVLVSPLNTYENVCRDAKKILESEISIADDLRLQVSCKAGNNLATMKEIT